MAALMMLVGLYSFFTMSKDIFPAVNLPEVNLVWYYPGMSAPEIEKRIVNLTERAVSQTVTGVDRIESNSFTGIGDLSYTTQRCPPFRRRRTIFAPILPRPIIPSCIGDSLSGTLSRWSAAASA
jgi:hypothetical protein